MRDKQIFISDEEKEELMSKFIVNNNYEDMANFFISQNYITSEDVFEYHFLSTNRKYYLNVFQHIINFLLDPKNTHNFKKYMGNIIQKLHINCYKYSKCFNGKTIDRDLILCSFLTDVVEQLAINSRTSDLLFVIVSLCDVETINVEVVKRLIATNKQSYIFGSVVEEIVSSRYLPLEDTLDIIEYRFGQTLNSDITSYFRMLYRTEDDLVSIVNLMLTKYDFTFKNNKCKMKCLYRGKRRMFYEFLRKYLSESIIPIAENELFSIMNTIKNNSQTLGFFEFARISSNIIEFLKSTHRFQTFLINRNTIGSESTYSDISFSDVMYLQRNMDLMEYIAEIETLETFPLFIRLFNIGRFNFLSPSRQMPIIKAYLSSRLRENDGNLYMLALDNRVYNLLLNF